jgi:aryl-alcohol dehydrogenase-like predicted oxidoreductase
MILETSDDAKPGQTKTPLPFLLGGEVPITRLGFGAMRLTGQPGNFGPFSRWNDGKALLRSVIDLGINFIDTARAYGPGWNEELIAEALHPYSSGLVVATKGGIEKRSSSDIRADGRPEALRVHLDESLRRLRVDTIDLYSLHRPDPRVALEDSVGELERLRTLGKLRFIGLSNVSPDQVRRAMRVAPIAAIQNRYNVAERSSDDVLELALANGILFVPYGPLGAAPLAHGAPLASGERDPSGLTAAQRALRALIARAPNVVPIPGTTSIEHLRENAGALEGLA